MDIKDKIKKAIRNPNKGVLFLLCSFYNFFINLKLKRRYTPSDLKELNEVKNYSLKKTDINDHLLTIFIESYILNPKLIVELGVRDGDSTFVLERVAKLCSSRLVSVDIENCSNVSNFNKWIFIQKDDIDFSKKFKSWCHNQQIEPKIDILFIDTSHEFEHTLEEINSWFSFLSDKSKVIFHDTNLKKIYHRKDGSVGYGWDNKRGVIRALENLLDSSFNEKEDFIDFRKNWLIRHYSYCNGLTILEKINK